MNRAPRFVVVAIGILVLTSSVMAQRITQDSQTRQDSIDSFVFENGTASLVGVTGVGWFTLAGSDLSLDGFLRDGTVAPAGCVPCTPGSTVGLRSSFGGVITGPLSYGSATFFNQTLNLYFGGQLVFDADPIQVPILRSRKDIVMTVPATVTGNIAGYFFNPFVGDPGPPVFLSTVNLQGTATVVLKLMDPSPLNLNRLYTFHSISYDFPPIQSPN